MTAQPPSDSPVEIEALVHADELIAAIAMDDFAKSAFRTVHRAVNELDITAEVRTELDKVHDQMRTYGSGMYRLCLRANDAIDITSVPMGDVITNDDAHLIANFNMVTA